MFKGINIELDSLMEILLRSFYVSKTIEVVDKTRPINNQ
jgi:hypothetical protein